MAELRIGQGCDSHVLAPGRPLFIGGAEIASKLGAVGHSDGDCLLHALTDAILGALALGDIGMWFPDRDPVLSGIRSTELLARVLESPRTPGFRFVNVDTTLILDAPKISEHREKILASLEKGLRLPAGRIGLKAKTWEGLRFERPLIAASASVLLELL